jgi:tRNA-uridine 2-sulfurtransferase
MHRKNDPDAAFEATAKIRYSHPGTPATVTPLENGRAHVRLHEPQRAVTPGQASVIYDGDVVLGGGWICRTESVTRSEASVLI